MQIIAGGGCGWVQQKWRGAGGGVVMILLLLLQSLSLSTAPLWYTASVRARRTRKKVELAIIEGQMQFMQSPTPSTVPRAQKGQRFTAQAPT